MIAPRPADRRIAAATALAVWIAALLFALATYTFSDRQVRRRIPLAGTVSVSWGAIGPPAVLAAWMWYRFARSPRGTSRGWRAGRAAIALCVLATMVIATEWRSSLSLIRPNSPLFTRLTDAAAIPPSTALLPKPRLAGLVNYLQRCTRPEDRVFAGWFA